MADEQLVHFLRSLKEKDLVGFILSSGLIRGSFVKYYDSTDIVEISDPYFLNIHVDLTMTIPRQSILAWGKRVSA